MMGSFIVLIIKGMNMKKVLMVSALLMQLGSSYAQTIGYGGVGAGVSVFTPERDVSDTILFDPPLPFPTSYTHNQDGGAGAAVSAFLGLKQHINVFGIAVELGGKLSSAEAKGKINNYAFNNVTAESIIREQGSVNLSVLPSIDINRHANIFLRAGIARGHYELKSNADTGGNLIATGKTTEWVNGFIVGGGLETMITCSMSMRFEYDYSRYHSITQRSVLPPDININSDIILSKVRPQDHTLMVSFILNTDAGRMFQS